MSKARSTIVAKLVVAVTLILFVVAQHPGVLSSAEALKATVAVKHKPLKHFVAGHRISVKAKVADPQGVSLVRCYFRATGQADYVFVGMKAGEKDTFAGVLPAPSVETKAIEYLFLTVNVKSQVVRTQVFRTERMETEDVPEWQDMSGDGQVTVGSELPQATAPVGFADSVVVDVVESSLRFGFVAGIYSTTQITGTGGTTTAGGTSDAAVAVSAGTVAASTGISTMAIAGAGAAAVAVGAGLAVAVSGGEGIGGVGGGGGSSSECSQYEGNWSGTFRGTRCNWGGMTGSYPITVTVKANCDARFCIEGCSDDHISGNAVTFRGSDECGESTFSCVFTSPSSLSGTYSLSLGGSGTWSATKQ